MNEIHFDVSMEVSPFLNNCHFIIFFCSFRGTVNAEKSKDMKPVSSKRMIRIEKKKKKMAALLQISQLNEYDRANKSARLIDKNSESRSSEAEPSAKRLRTDINENQSIVEIEK